MTTTAFRQLRNVFHPGLTGAFGKTAAGQAWSPSEKERQVLQTLFRNYQPEERETNKYQFERLWFLCAAFYEGNQFTVWNERTQRLEVRAAPPWRVHYTANWIVTAVQRAISMIVGNQPIPTVAPNGPTLEDRQKALLAEQVWENFARQKQFDKLVREALLMSSVTGNAFVKATWDPNAGEVFQTGDEKNPIYALGDVALEVASPFQIYVDPFARSIEESSWIVQATLKPLAYVRTHYPERGKFVVPEQGGTLRSWFERRLLTMSSHYGYAPSLEGTDRHDVVTVIEYWERPSDEWPEGMHVIVANDIVLYPTNEEFGNPYVGLSKDRTLELPYFHLGFWPAVNRFWHMGLVEHLMPVIRERNITVSQVIENKNLMSRPKWLVPNTAATKESSFTTEPGEVIEYNPMGGKPEVVVPPPLPAYVNAHLDSLREDFERVAAQSEATMGQAPGSVRTGIGIELLQERDESVYAPVRQKTWEVLSQVAKATLTLMQEKYDTPRLLQIAGPNNTFRVSEFKGTDIYGATDLRFLIRTSLGASAQARRANILDLQSQGFINVMNPLERAVALRAMGASDLDGIVEDLLVDQREAEDENAVMSRERADGMGYGTAPVHEFQNHEIHLAIHTRYMKTPEFRQLPVDAQVNIIEHSRLHKAQLEAMRQAALLEQIATRGGPGGKGTPSPPKMPAGRSQGAQGTKAVSE